MGSTVIDVVVSGAPNLRDTANEHLEMVVVKMPGCCEICAANEDPQPVLDGGLHANCRCEVEFEEED
jgi:hypothetical protein